VIIAENSFVCVVVMVCDLAYMRADGAKLALLGCGISAA
tara:strand:- start:143 stop:259 length:117 start_codon:yes stop_codon:yes gene_type:complete